MKRTVTTSRGEIEYELNRKSVKNINVRITPSGEVRASAPYFVSVKRVDELVKKCEDKIFAIRETAKASKSRELQKTEKEEFKATLTELSKEIFLLFPEIKTPFPQIKLRKMTSRWGSCNASKNIITFSTELYFKPIDSVYYVVAHEICHLVVQNHSEKFWARLERVVPNCKAARKRLNQK